MSSTSSLAGKTALITGGTKGIGKAVAIALVTRGANVVVNYSSDDSSAKALVDQLGAEHVLAVKGDAGSVADIEEMVKATVDRFGKIDILMPKAAVLIMSTLENTTEEQFDRSYTLNVKGPSFLAQKAIPHMSPGSSIIFVSTSICAFSACSGPYCLYTSTKGAIEQLNRVAAKELALKGIRVNAVSPGAVATELSFKDRSDEMIQVVEQSSPFNRVGKPEEIADAVLFLAGDEGRWIAGQNLRVKGAMTVG